MCVTALHVGTDEDGYKLVRINQALDDIDNDGIEDGGSRHRRGRCDLLTQLSRTISDTSNRRLPETWRDVTLREYATLVRQMTVAPIFLAWVAASTVTALRPETEWMIMTSPGFIPAARTRTAP